MKQYDREITNPIIIEEELRFAKGTITSRRSDLIPALVGGDWLVSPQGVEGYIAGRSDETPGAWIFVIKTGPGVWDQTSVEMMSDAFIGFSVKPKEMGK